MRTLSVVDVDDRATWPSHIAEFAEEWAEQLRGTTEFTSDLAIPIEQCEDFLRMLKGHLVRAYHCTRLLTHEVEMINAQGLRTLNKTLIADRIDAAHRAGAITEAERKAFELGHVLSSQDPDWSESAPYREGQVCLMFSRNILDEHAHGVHSLLSMWGGEAIYFPLKQRHGERLRSIGRPAIVVVHVDVAASPGRDRLVPHLDRTFVGVALGLDDVGCEMLHRASIPPEQIEAIWHPGDRGYDRHLKLPRL